MSVITVNGEIDAKNLGITLAHEHLFIDITWAVPEIKDPVRKALFNKKIELENLGILRRIPTAIRENCILDDEKLIESELHIFKNAGGDTIIDQSSRGINYDPLAARRLARATDVNIVLGTGHYTTNLHPSDMDDRTTGDFEKEYLADIIDGIDGTGVRAGILGELGVSTELHTNEKKVLIASAQVSKKAGVAISVHIPGKLKQDDYPLGLTALDIITNVGADPEKVAICHANARNINLEYCLEVLERGAYL